MTQGSNILIAGLVMQATSIVLFYSTYWYFRYRLHHRRYVLDPKYAEVYCSAKFKIFVMCKSIPANPRRCAPANDIYRTGMQIAAAFLLVRTIVQIAALADGLDGSVFQSEIVSMMLDGTPVLVSCLILSILPAGAVFGRAWQQTSPFRSGAGLDDDDRRDDDADLRLRRWGNQPRTHRRNISPPFPAMLPRTYQPRRPPYRPAGPAPMPPTRRPVVDRPPYASSCPRKAPFLSPGACVTPTTSSSSKVPAKASLVKSDNLW